MSMPRWMKIAPLVGVSALLIPPLLALRARTLKSPQPRIHPIQDMDNQPKVKTQRLVTLFADRRGMRPPEPGTVARGDLELDEHLYRGRVDGTWATTFPMPVTDEMMQRGRERYTVFCAPCHGWDGAGRGPVAVRAEELEEGSWVPPLSYHDPQVRGRPVGHLYNTITNGIRSMAMYGPQIPVTDRWAIVAYIRALQQSQNARLEDVPPELRDSLPPMEGGP